MLVVASIDLPYDPNPQCGKSSKVTVGTRGLELIIGCNSTARHVVWASSGTNSKGIALVDYLSTTDLIVVNMGNSPKFVNARHRDVLDIIACTAGFLARTIFDWGVSDHRQIYLCMESLPVVQTHCKPRQTDQLDSVL